MEQGQQRGKHGVTQFLSAITDPLARFSNHETDLWILLNERGCIKWVWPGFERALGYRVENILGCPIIDFIDIDTLATFIKSFDWYNKPYPPFKMLHRGGGLVDVRMEWREFVKDECYIILRLI